MGYWPFRLWSSFNSLLSGMVLAVQRLSQLAIICSKLAIETLEQSVKYVQRYE